MAGVNGASDGSDNPTRTMAQFCHYNSAFGGYAYTPAWVDYLVRKISDPATYAEILAWQPPAEADPSAREPVIEHDRNQRRSTPAATVEARI